jgi:hypothetical protein
MELNNHTETKKGMLKLIRLLHKRFMKMDFKFYTEEPKSKTEFFTSKLTKDRYKKIVFNYGDKTSVVYFLNKLEYNSWRANFPIQY